MHRCTASERALANEETHTILQAEYPKPIPHRSPGTRRIGGERWPKSEEGNEGARSNGERVPDPHAARAVGDVKGVGRESSRGTFSGETDRRDAKVSR